MPRQRATPRSSPPWGRPARRLNGSAELYRSRSRRVPSQLQPRQPRRPRRPPPAASATLKASVGRPIGILHRPSGAEAPDRHLRRRTGPDSPPAMPSGSTSTPLPATGTASRSATPRSSPRSMPGADILLDDGRMRAPGRAVERGASPRPALIRRAGGPTGQSAQRALRFRRSRMSAPRRCGRVSSTRLLCRLCGLRG